MSNNSGRSGGIGFTGLLTVLFIGLKLTHYIDWSWWWVLSPMWIPIALVLAILIVGFTVCGLLWVIETSLGQGKSRK